ncbi:MAG TPA: transketolase [Micromonosporaceae bacterium]|nr:transketolase [Micromonosporaceae bacterium]
MRERFIKETLEILDEDPRAALVLAEISADPFAKAFVNHPDRAINVGIREQLMIGVAGGLALNGMRPIAHSYATFLIDRAYEQIKLDLKHQGVGAILVSVGASYDGAQAGYTHMSPMDVSLLDTLPGWQVHTPGHPDEVGPLLRAAMTHDEPVYIRLSTKVNAQAHPDAMRLKVIRPGGKRVVLAVGPMLQPVLDATEGLDVTVVYTHTPRPFDHVGLSEIGGAEPDVVVVEPYLEGTSAHLVAETFAGRAFRLQSIGVKPQDLHRYGTPKDHARWHGLDPATLRESIG